MPRVAIPGAQRPRQAGRFQSGRETVGRRQGAFRAASADAIGGALYGGVPLRGHHEAAGPPIGVRARPSFIAVSTAPDQAICQLARVTGW